MKTTLLALMVGCLGGSNGRGSETAGEPPTAPSVIELRDQFDVSHRIVFPATNGIVLILADKDGARQVDWSEISS